MKVTFCIVFLVGFAVSPAFAEELHSTRPVIVSPTDGAIVSNPVNVTFRFGDHHHAAGTMAAGEGTSGGHLHLFIDVPQPAEDSPIPMDAHHVHLMHGESTSTLSLQPGRHTIQLVQGGKSHTVLPGAMNSERVSFEVK